MRLDAQLAFIPIGGNVPILGAPVASNIIDLLGQGVGQAPGNIIGNRTLFGEDAGIGAFRPEIAAALGAAFVGGTSLNMALQAAPDTGIGGGYQPGAWTTLGETGAVVTASLVAGAKLGRLPFLPAVPENLNPRYLRLLFTPIGTFTAGTIAYAIPTFVRDDQANKFAAKNYTAQ